MFQMKLLPFTELPKCDFCTTDKNCKRHREKNVPIASVSPQKRYKGSIAG